MIHPIPTLRTRGPIARPSLPAHARLSAPMTLAIGSLLCLSACLSEGGLTPDEGKDPDPVAIDSSRIKDSLRVLDSIHVQDSLRTLPLVFAITSDYKTGSYSVHGLDSNYTKVDVDPIHSDAGVRYLGGDDIFIINRYKRDNLQVVDRRNLKTVMQIAFPSLSNPQDVALKDGLIYVAFYSLAKIGIYRQEDGVKAGEIDISAYADTSDHLPETAALKFVNGDLYAVLQNLDVNYSPLTGQLLKIDVAAKTVKQALALPFGNPAGITWDPASGKLYIPCRGGYSNPDYSVKTDGGIAVVDASTLELADTLALETDLGGNVNSALIYGGNLIMVVGKGMSDDVVAISLVTGQAAPIVKLGGYASGGLAIDAPSRTLCVGDRKKGGPGLRLFDLAAFTEKSAPGIDLGLLPPSDLAVIR
jgi:hypothetical protein